jgi:hypothetical protein
MRTINQTLHNIGFGAGRVLLDTIESFESMELTDQERVSAIASAIAGCALAYHGSRIAGYLDAIRASALEIALAILPAAPTTTGAPALGRIAEGAELLSGGLEQLLDALSNAAIGLEDRVVAEIALYARLLGRHDPNTVLNALRGVDDALNHPDFTEGDLIAVLPIDAGPIDPTMPLDGMPILGIA